MFIVHISPIVKGPSKDTLTYFSSEKIDEGSIVRIKIRQKIVSGIVVGNEKVSENKTEIRSLSYSLKKIEKDKPKKIFLSSYLDAIKRTSQFFACPVGSVLSSLVPQKIIEQVDKLSFHTDSSSVNNKNPNISIIQCEEEERFAHYRSLIRESFARKKSIFMILPSIEEVIQAKEKLEKGIENYVHVLHGELTKKDLLFKWNSIQEEPHTVLIIATPTFLGLPRNDIGTFILEKEKSRGYIQITRPYIHIRDFVKELSKESGARLILGDLPLSIESVSLFNNHEANEYAPLKWKILCPAKIKLINMSELQKIEGNKEQMIISGDLSKLILKNKETNGKLFILSNRKGLSPLISCNDCGTVVSCKKCGSTISLHQAKGSSKKIMLCHKCGQLDRIPEECEVCGGWNLVPLGIGVDTVVEKIKDYFPDIPIYKLDRDSFKTNKQAKNEIKKFLSSSGSVLVGTEMVFGYLKEPIENTAVASIDSLFGLSDYQITEKIFDLLLKTRQLATDDFLVQTRRVGDQVFEYALSGNLIDFYRKEEKERKNFGYPPFKNLIKVSIQVTKQKLEEETKKLESIFEKYDPDIFLGTASKLVQKQTLNLLIKVQKENWPDEEIISKLKSLSPAYSIQINPNSVI